MADANSITDTGEGGPDAQPRPFNLLAVAQAGRLQYEALLLAASLRAMDPGFPGRVILAEPRPTGAWAGHATEIDSSTVRAALDRLEVEILPFEAHQFGAAYPNGNKIEALTLLPEGEPFLFLDTDTLITGALSQVPVATEPPAASMRREGTWPVIELYGPGYDVIWGSLYTRFGLDFSSSLDLAHPQSYWQRYLYFNAGWFTGPCPHIFGHRFLETACAIRDDPPAELVCQPLDPWLDQIALPLVIHGLGGGRPGPALARLDGGVACHWRVMSLLFARESDRVVEVLRDVSATPWVKKALKEYEPFRRLIYQRKGEKARALFDRDNLPHPEVKIRKRLKNNNLWYR
ncbi:MAG: hypothetical protein AAFU80_17840 [Pseudomonadota bacterium]